ncbi:hypothetical protein BH23CHL7_BH23CHL7_06840 [soil metagenome]
MIPNRESGADRPNEELLEFDPYSEPAPETAAPETAAPESSAADVAAEETSPGPGEEQGNVAWLGRSDLRTGILLLGGTSLADFRVRFAQAQLRSDLTPSHWSMCGLLGEDGTVQTVPLQPADIGEVPVTNAVRTMSVDDFDDAQAWPNIAVLRFAEGTAAIDDHVATAMRRTVVDLPALLLSWLGFVWGVGDNPLVGGKGVPSAVFVETCYGLAGIELTPGLSSSASCPEAIWQAVKWWHEYYAGVAEIGASEAGSVRPSGNYLVRQPSAQMAIAER